MLTENHFKHTAMTKHTLNVALALSSLHIKETCIISKELIVYYMIAKSIKAIYPSATWYEEFVSSVKEVKREDDAEFFTIADALTKKSEEAQNEVMK